MKLFLRALVFVIAYTPIVKAFDLGEADLGDKLGGGLTQIIEDQDGQKESASEQKPSKPNEPVKKPIKPIEPVEPIKPKQPIVQPTKPTQPTEPTKTIPENITQAINALNAAWNNSPFKDKPGKAGCPANKSVQTSIKNVAESTQTLTTLKASVEAASEVVNNCLNKNLSECALTSVQVKNLNDFAQAQEMLMSALISLLADFKSNITVPVPDVGTVYNLNVVTNWQASEADIKNALDFLNSKLEEKYPFGKGCLSVISPDEHQAASGAISISAGALGGIFGSLGALIALAIITMKMVKDKDKKDMRNLLDDVESTQLQDLPEGKEFSITESNVNDFFKKKKASLTEEIASLKSIENPTQEQQQQIKDLESKLKDLENGDIAFKMLPEQIKLQMLQNDVKNIRGVTELLRNFNQARFDENFVGFGNGTLLDQVTNYYDQSLNGFNIKEGGVEDKDDIGINAHIKMLKQQIKKRKQEGLGIEIEEELLAEAKQDKAELSSQFNEFKKMSSTLQDTIHTYVDSIKKFQYTPAQEHQARLSINEAIANIRKEIAETGKYKFHGPLRLESSIDPDIFQIINIEYDGSNLEVKLIPESEAKTYGDTIGTEIIKQSSSAPSTVTGIGSEIKPLESLSSLASIYNRTQLSNGFRNIADQVQELGKDYTLSLNDLKNLYANEFPDVTFTTDGWNSIVKSDTLLRDTLPEVNADDALTMPSSTTMPNEAEWNDAFPK